MDFYLVCLKIRDLMRIGKWKVVDNLVGDCAWEDKVRQLENVFVITLFIIFIIIITTTIVIITVIFAMI